MLMDGWMKKWVHNDDGKMDEKWMHNDDKWMDEEGEGGGGSLAPTYEKMGNRWISVFFNTPVHYVQGIH
jgi:hypothetical protein